MGHANILPLLKNGDRSLIVLKKVIFYFVPINLSYFIPFHRCKDVEYFSVDVCLRDNRPFHLCTALHSITQLYMSLFTVFNTTTLFHHSTLQSFEGHLVSLEQTVIIYFEKAQCKANSFGTCSCLHW